MPRLTPKDIQRHREFLLRQKQAEGQYINVFYRYLASIYANAAKIIEDQGIEAYYKQAADLSGSQKLLAIYKRLYTRVIMREAVIENKHILSYDDGKKDIINDLASQFSFDSGNIIKLWRQLVTDFIQVRVAERVSQVERTTKKALANIIEKGISDGLGSLDIANIIRKEQQFNRNRSLAIARTETVSAANQGKFMAALSSPFMMEKAWAPTLDDKTRESHAEMISVPWIPIEQTFLVSAPKGGSDIALYPCAETLSASNTVNCRCVMLTRPMRGPSGNLLRKL